MPLTDFQRAVLRLLAQNRGPDSYMAGGAALHFAPNSHRFSNDLDFFHHSEERVATAFAADTEVQRRAGLGLEVELSPGGGSH
jgi:predicted nucleotidyltransferase component of viral defense system